MLMASRNNLTITVETREFQRSRGTFDFPPVQDPGHVYPGQPSIGYKPPAQISASSVPRSTVYYFEETDSLQMV